MIEKTMEMISAHRKFHTQPGFERIRRLLAELGNPQEQLRFIHVVGTNGKGTTCAYIDSAMREAGYKTGLYTSPFVIDFRERFRIDGQMISEKDLEETALLVSGAEKRLENCAFTEFEFITALGLTWFAREKCEAVVLEAGMGGGSDTTNVIERTAVSVIVSVSLDHTAVLGDTLEKIAREKARVIKPGGTVVLYPDLAPRAREIAVETARERNARVLSGDKEGVTIRSSDLWGTDFTYEEQDYHIGFSGLHQVYNAVNAITALKALKGEFPRLTDAHIAAGLKTAFIPGRMEILSREPLVMVDGGHNPGCAEALRDVVNAHLKGKNVTAIIGMMADKDSSAYLEDVAGLFHRILAVKPGSPRGMEAAALAEKARPYCARVSAAGTVARAVEEAFADIGPKDALVVCGSFFVAADARREILRKLKAD